MMALLLALSIASAPACVGDGHNQRRSKSAIKHFQKAWARAHRELPCPEECARRRVHRLRAKDGPVGPQLGVRRFEQAVSPFVCLAAQS